MADKIFNVGLVELDVYGFTICRNKKVHVSTMIWMQHNGSGVDKVVPCDDSCDNPEATIEEYVQDQVNDDLKKLAEYRKRGDERSVATATKRFRKFCRSLALIPGLKVRGPKEAP